MSWNTACKMLWKNNCNGAHFSNSDILSLKLQSFPTFVHVLFLFRFQISGTTGLGFVWTFRWNKFLNPSNQAGLRHLNRRSWYCLPVRAQYCGCPACKNLFFKFIQVSQLIRVPPALSRSLFFHSLTQTSHPYIPLSKVRHVH